MRCSVLCVFCERESSFNSSFFSWKARKEEIMRSSGDSLLTGCDASLCELDTLWALKYTADYNSSSLWSSHISFYTDSLIQSLSLLLKVNPICMYTCGDEKFQPVGIYLRVYVYNVYTIIILSLSSQGTYVVWAWELLSRVDVWEWA